MKKKLSNGIADVPPAGPMFRRTLLCKTGTWEGANGECIVTKEILEGLAERYNKERATPLNQNDYAPILVNHDRRAENVNGRLDISRTRLTVEKLPDGEFGLFGELRIDDDHAKHCVNTGRFAQVSLSFDDESFEIYEVSFVAVEAARRSQVLSKGDKKMKNKKHALAMVNQVIKQNKEVSLALVKGATKAKTGVSSLETQVRELQLKVKTSSLKGLFHGLIREGKMNKAELSKLNLKELAALSPAALLALTNSYKSRKPSTDIQQFGQEGAKQIPTKNLSSAEFRDLAKQQLSKGKKGVNLESGDKDKDKDQNLNQNQDDNKDLSTDDDAENLEMGDVEDIEKVLEECLKGLKTLSESVSTIQSYAKKLNVEEKKENELEADEDDEDKKDIESGDEEELEEEDDEEKNNNGEGKGE